MENPVALKLPRYMFRRANGSFRYKRNVPKELRSIIPKATVYRQLGATYDDAIRALPKVHAEIEALFDQERRTTDAGIYFWPGCRPTPFNARLEH
jgi:hypothetical protein